jgi:hypothetical protein
MVLVFASCRCLHCQVVADVVEVAGDDAPAEVPEEAILPMIGTASETIIPAEAAQSSLDSGAPAIATPAGALPFLRLSRFADHSGAR